MYCKITCRQKEQRRFLKPSIMCCSNRLRWLKNSQPPHTKSSSSSVFAARALTRVARCCAERRAKRPLANSAFLSGKFLLIFLLDSRNTQVLRAFLGEKCQAKVQFAWSGWANWSSHRLEAAKTCIVWREQMLPAEISMCCKGLMQV